MWQNFHQSPARRDIYIKETKCEIFPLPFCKTRWIEDEPVAARAIQLWPNIVKVIKYFQSLCRSKRPQNNKSYDTLVAHHTSSIIEVKLHFFKYVAAILKVFLVGYQTDKPMLPFLCNDIDIVLRQLLKIFMRRDVIENAVTLYKLIKLDVSNKELWLPFHQIHLGTATKTALNKSGATDSVKLKFKEDCVLLLVKMIAKIQERSPLKYSIARNSSCFSPLEMIRNKEACILKLGSLADKLYEMKWISASDSDSAKQQFDTLITSANHEHKDRFQMFDQYKDRVDSFLGLYLHNCVKFSSIWKVCKITFTLSHGQAAVERGFSVNKEVLVENLEQLSLVSQRLVYDHMTFGQSAQLQDFKIERQLLLSCKSAHARYKEALEENKKVVIVNDKASKRKMIQEEISDIKKRKVVVEKCILSLESDIEKYSSDAEKEQDMTLLTKANSFRKAVVEKKDNLKTFDIAINKLSEECKQLS